MDRVKIGNRYTKKFLILDVISLLSQMTVTFIGEYLFRSHWVVYYFIKIFTFLRISSLINTQRRLSNFFNTKPKLLEWIQVLQLFAFLLLLAHIVAIMFHALAQFEILYLGYNNTWLHSAHIEHENWMIRYLNSVFWATSSMVTVILFNPDTLEETIFINIILLFNCLVFGFTLNTLGDILKDLNKDQKDLNQEINIINRYLIARQVSSNLKIKIRNYLEYMNKNLLTKNQHEENQVICKLSNALRDELKREINFKRVKLFAPIFKNFSQTILFQLLLKVQEVNITPNDMVIKSGILDDCSIYVVSAGEIQITLKRDDEIDGSAEGEEKIVKILKKGEIFGEVSFFTGEARKASAKSVDFGQLYKISRQDFIQLLKGRSLDEEKFAVLKDSLLLYKQYEKIGLKCYVCENQNHLSLECNKIQLSLNKRKVLLPELRNYEQIRSKSYKRERRKNGMTGVNAFQVQKDCWIALEQFIQNNYEEIDQYEVDYQINDYSITFEEDDDINNMLNPNTNNQNIIEQSGDDEDSCKSHNHISNQQKVITETTNAQQHQHQQNKEHPQPSNASTVQQPSINQWLANSKQQVPDGKNFHDYLEIFNKEMRIQQKSSSKLKRQGSMQTVNVLKEMNKQRQGVQQKKSIYRNEEVQKQSEKVGDFLHPKDQKDNKRTSSSYKNQNSQSSYPSSNNISDSEEDKNITDENKKNLTEENSRNMREENKRSITDENRRSINLDNSKNSSQKQMAQQDKQNSNSNFEVEDSLKEENTIDEDDLCSFRDQQIDEATYNAQTNLPSINPHLNLNHQDKNNDDLNQTPIKVSKDDKNKYTQLNKLYQQRELTSSFFNGKNASQLQLRSHSSQKSIKQEEKQNNPQNGFLNFEGVQVSIDISTPSQTTSYSIGSNMRGIPSKKQVGQTDDRRVSSISSINAKRASRDSVFFKQHNVPFVLNSPYKQSPINNSVFNFNVQQSPHLENQLSTITEDLNLLDEQIGIGSINQQVFSAFIKKPNSTINEADNSSPQFLQFQDQQSLKSNLQPAQNQSTLPIVQMRNFPSFSRQSQGSTFENQQPTYLQNRQQLPQTPLSNKAIRNIKMAELRRRSMFSTQNAQLEQQSRLFSPNLNVTSQKNILPQYIPILNQQSSDQSHQPSTNSSLFYAQQKQNSKQKRKQSQRIINDSIILPANHYNKRQSILKNPSKFGLFNTPQIQAIQQTTPLQNNQNSPLNLQQIQNLRQPIHLNSDNMILNNSLLYQPSQMGQQMSFHTMKHEQQYMDQSLYIYDVMKLFKIYFILGNYDIVLAQIEQHRKKSLKKNVNGGQSRRLITRNKKEKAFTQFSSLQMKKNLLLSLNSNFTQNINSDIPKKLSVNLQNPKKEMNKLGIDFPIFKKIQSEIN